MRQIDADALIPMMKYATTDSEIGVFPIKIGFNAIIEVINNAPTIDAEPVRYGEWILWDGKYDSGYCICSRCRRPTGVVDAFQTYKYCPFCGAKMDAEGKEE